MNEEIKEMIKSQIVTIKKDMDLYENEEEYKYIKEQLDLLLRIKANSKTLCNIVEKVIDKI